MDGKQLGVSQRAWREAIREFRKDTRFRLVIAAWVVASSVACVFIYFVLKFRRPFVLLMICEAVLIAGTICTVWLLYKHRIARDARARMRELGEHICEQCGYDLSATDEGMSCPECGWRGGGCPSS